MERYLARVCWNDCDWKRPCGHPAGSSFVEQYGFGFEEWLNRDEIRLNGLRYAFVQGVSRSQQRLQGQEIALDLFTISASRIPYIVAHVKEARVLSPEDSLRATRELKANGVVKQMRDEVAAVGRPTSAVQVDKELAMFNLSFKPDSLRMRSPHQELTSSAIRGRTRFQLYRAIALGSQRAGGTANSKSERGEQQARYVEAKQLLLVENQMQNELFRLLERQFGNGHVVRERDHVDITVLDEAGLPRYLIEVKSAEEPRLAVRAALGQLLEYAHYPRELRRMPAPDLIIVARGVLDAACGAYLSELKRRYGFTVRYIHYQQGGHSFML